MTPTPWLKAGTPSSWPPPGRSSAIWTSTASARRCSGRSSWTPTTCSTPTPWPARGSSTLAPAPARPARGARGESLVGWRPLGERDDVEAVVVCTPPHLHAEISIAAMRRGKHVLCEKPLARSIPEAQEMLATAAKEGGRVQCGFNHRFHPGIQQAYEWFKDGAIGSPLFLRCRYGICGRPGYENEWRCDPRIVGGGQMMEQGIHAVDLARWFLGDFAEVTAFVETRFWPIAPLEDNAFALYRTQDGVVASIHSTLSQWKNLFSFELFGRDGYIPVEGLGGGYDTERP